MNTLHLLLPPLQIWLNKLGMKKNLDKKKKPKEEQTVRKWEKEYTLMPENPIIYDYCELIVQELIEYLFYKL